MPRLISFISNEIDRNAYFFSTLEGSLFTAIDFIEYVLKDESFMKLSEQDQRFVHSLQNSYHKIKGCCAEIREEIVQYKSDLGCKLTLGL